MRSKSTNPDSLLSIPGVGVSISQNLKRIGIHAVKDLKGKNPEKLYKRSNEREGATQDPCLLYTFRCAVYFAEGGRNAQKLKWWNWKDIKK